MRRIFSRFEEPEERIDGVELRGAHLQCSAELIGISDG